MKAGLLFLTVVVLVTIVASDSVYNGNGQPQKCPKADKTMHRNTWDPTRYWLCETAGQAGVAVQCPGDAPAFISSKEGCGDWQTWKWTPPIEPSF